MSDAASDRDDDPRSRPDDAVASYLARVEALVVTHTRTGLNLSARDVHLVRRWQREGVPVEIVARAFERAIARWTEPRPPRSLQFAAAEVDALMARHLRANPGAGTHTSEPPGNQAEPNTEANAAQADPWPRLAATLVELGRRARARSPARAALRLGYTELQRQAALDPRPAPHEAWVEVRARALDHLRATLSTFDRAQLERELATLAVATMSPQAAAAHQRRWTERWLASRHELDILLQWPPPPVERDLDDDDETS